jgi:hypothetical protein
MCLIRRDNDNLIKFSSSGSGTGSLADIFIFDSCYRRSPLYAVFTFWNTSVNSNTVPVGIATHIVSYVYVKGGPTEVQIPTRWDLTGCSTIDLPPVLWPSIIVPLPLIPARKN